MDTVGWLLIYSYIYIYTGQMTLEDTTADNHSIQKQ